MLETIHLASSPARAVAAWLLVCARRVLCLCALGWLPLASATGSVEFDVVATLAPTGDRIELSFNRPLDHGHTLSFDNDFAQTSNFLVYHQVKAELGNWIEIDSVSYDGTNTVVIAIAGGTVQPGHFVTVQMKADAVRDTAGNAYRGHTVIADNLLPANQVFAEFLVSTGAPVPAGQVLFHETEIGRTQLEGTLRVTVTHDGSPVANTPVRVWQVANNTSWSSLAGPFDTDSAGVVELPALTLGSSFYVLRVANAFDTVMTIVPAGQKLVRAEVNGSYSRTVRNALTSAGNSTSITNNNYLEIHGADHHLHHYRVADTAVALDLLVEDETIPWGTRTILHRQALTSALTPPPYEVDIRNRNAYLRTWKPREPGDSKLRDVFELTLSDADTPATRQTFAVRGPWDRDIEFWISNDLAHPHSRIAWSGQLADVAETYAVYVHLAPTVFEPGTFHPLNYPQSDALSLMYAVDAYNGGIGSAANDLPTVNFTAGPGGPLLAEVRMLLRPFHASTSSRRDAVYRLADSADGIAAHIGSSTYVVGHGGLWYYFTGDHSQSGPLPLRVTLGSALGLRARHPTLGRGETQRLEVVDKDGFVLTRLINNALQDQEVIIAISHDGNQLASVTDAAWSVPADAAFGTYQAELLSAQAFALDADAKFANFEVGLLVTDGSCGSANGVRFTSTPGSGLCATGTTGPLLGDASGPWYWTCEGVNGGTTAMCTANPTVLPELDPAPFVPPIEDWPGLVDDDGDGIPDYIEGLAPAPDGDTMGDGNGDGIADFEQAHVASLPLLAGGGFATIESGGGHPLRQLSSLAAPATLPTNSSMPFGLLAFHIDDVPPGGSDTVVVYVPYDPRINAYLKLDRISGEWHDIAESITRVGNKTRVDFTLTDGDRFDHDGSANGSIDDPGGPAIVSAGALAPIPTLSQWSTLALVLLLATIASARNTPRRDRG